MGQELSVYLEPTWFIDADNPKIMEAAQQLTAACCRDQEKVVKLFYFVRDQIHYNMYDTSANKENYPASAVLNTGHGWCVQKAILLAALGRACGIPSRLIIVAIRNHKSPAEAHEIMGTDVFFPHAYNQFYIDGLWIKCAATFDKDICERIGVATVEFDGVNDAILPGLDLVGQPYIDYLEEFGYYADFPWEWVWEKSSDVYGEKLRNWMG